MIEMSQAIDSRQLLTLVQRALDEFDSVPLPATLRRTTRIASILGETRTAVKLGLDLKADGGHPPSNAEATRRLMSDREEWGVPGNLAEQALEEWMAGRMVEGDLIAAHSVGTLLFWEEREPSHSDMDAHAYEDSLKTKLKRMEILDRIRHEAFTSLCEWERQLSFSATQATALEGVSRRVDALLAQRAPTVLDQFNVAFRRLREASTGTEGEATRSEALAQCVTSCRRILKAIVDSVQPAADDLKESDEGNRLTDDKYRNRLVEYLKAHVTSSSHEKMTIKDAQSLHERFAAVDSLSNKGVHAQIALSEAEFVALHTYLLAGQILLIDSTRFTSSDET